MTMADSALMDSIEIRVVKDFRSEYQHMVEPWCNFFQNEPTCSMIKAFRDPANKDKLKEMLKEKATSDPDCLCVLAWDTQLQQAAGIIVTNTLYDVESEKPKPKTWANYQWDEETIAHIRNIDAFLERMIKECDITKKYGVDKALVIDITSVCKEYTRKGLAHRMTEVLLEEAKKRGYPLVMSESTSAFTQRNKMQKFGFEPVMEFDFAKYFASFSSLSEEVKKNHHKAIVLAKRL